jgi:hypothetical protein
VYGSATAGRSAATPVSDKFVTASPKTDFQRPMLAGTRRFHSVQSARSDGRR